MDAQLLSGHRTIVFALAGTISSDKDPPANLSPPQSAKSGEAGN